MPRLVDRHAHDVPAGASGAEIRARCGRSDARVEITVRERTTSPDAVAIVVHENERAAGRVILTRASRTSKNVRVAAFDGA